MNPIACAFWFIGVLYSVDSYENHNPAFASLAFMWYAFGVAWAIIDRPPPPPRRPA